MVRRALAAGFYLQALKAMNRQGATKRDLLTAYADLHAALRLRGDWDDARLELTNLCILMGLPDEALRHADRRVRQGEQAGDVLMRASGLAQRGEALEASGRHEQAAEVFRDALVLLDPDDPGHRGTYWAALSDMGAALMRAGQFAESYATQSEAYTRAIAASRHHAAAMDAAQLALLSIHLAQPERAVEWAESAAGHLREYQRQDPSAMPEVAVEVYGNRSLALSAARRHDEALATVAQTWPLVSGAPLPRRQLQLIAVEVAEAAARYDDAVALLGEMLAGPHLDPATRAMALNTRAAIRVKQGSPQQALSDLEESLRIRRRLGDQRGIAVVASNLVRAHLEAGSPADATRYVEDSERLWGQLAADAPDEPGQAGLAELIRPLISQSRQELCLASGDAIAALAAADRGRQGPLTTMLRIAHPGTAVPAEPPDPERIRALARRLDATLVLYSPIIRPETLQPEPSWATNLRAIHVWAITPGGRISHAEPPIDDFLALIQEARAARQHAEDPDGQEHAEAPDGQEEAIYASLGRLLLHPVADALPTSSGGRVIFLPAKFMWELALAALPLPDGEPLVASCPVSYAPSLHALEYLAAVRPQGAWRPASVLVAGTPDNAQAIQFDGSYQEAPSLPAVRRATQAVARLYGQAPLLGADCTVSAVLARLPAADLVHIESHADLDSHPRFDQPAGAILLTPGGGDHGQLTSDLIAQTRMNARLVVLAACSTGLGMPTFEGVRGLVRAFFSAGACGVIASLWPVVDRPAEMIMTWFHEALLETGDPARALQAATLRARRRWSDPAIWAAFTLYGL